MNKQFKSMGFCLAAAFLVIGMAFVPAVVAESTTGGPHFNGTYQTGLTSMGFWWNYYPETGYLLASPWGSPTSADKVNVSLWGLNNDDVKIVEIIEGDLTNAHGVLSELTNAVLLSKLPNTPSDIFGTDKPVYQINATVSDLYLNDPGCYTGEAMTLDTDWAVEGQEVKIAVVPANGYGVYDFQLHKGTSKTGVFITPVEDYISKSTDPEDGATTYILTMPNSAVTVEPMLRDGASTFITYVFLNADTYVLEIPADFSFKRIGTPVDGKMVNLTACELLDGHVLNVTLGSDNPYEVLGSDNTFRLRSVVDTGKFASYDIGMKKIYDGEVTFTPIVPTKIPLLSGISYDGYGKELLTTDGMSAAAIDSKILEGNMKTELKFTLKGVEDTSVLGKYKDQLMFIVDIVE